MTLLTANLPSPSHRDSRSCLVVCDSVREHHFNVVNVRMSWSGAPLTTWRSAPLPTAMLAVRLWIPGTSLRSASPCGWSRGAESTLTARLMLSSLETPGMSAFAEGVRDPSRGPGGRAHGRMRESVALTFAGPPDCGRNSIHRPPPTARARTSPAAPDAGAPLIRREREASVTGVNVSTTFRLNQQPNETLRTRSLGQCRSSVGMFVHGPNACSNC